MCVCIVYIWYNTRWHRGVPLFCVRLLCSDARCDYECDGCEYESKYEYEYENECECECLAKCSTSFCVGPRAPTNPIVWPRSLFINNKIRLVATSLARSLTHMLILQVGLLLLWLFRNALLTTSDSTPPPCHSPPLHPHPHPPTNYTCLPLCVCIEYIGMWQQILARHGFQIKVLQYNRLTDSRSFDLRSTETDRLRERQRERDRKIGNIIRLHWRRHIQLSTIYLYFHLAAGKQSLYIHRKKSHILKYKLKMPDLSKKF